VVQGRVDWALNHNMTKPGSILIVMEVKKLGGSLTGLPQLLVYMAAVLKYRSDRVNQSVFGMLSDSGTFQFAFLDETRKFYTSATFRWALQKSEILSYVDAILLDAIHSSPATTPMRTRNATIRNYQRYLKGRWNFGGQLDAVADVDSDSIVDIVEEENDQPSMKGDDADVGDGSTEC
jgi:hypothetical protein